MNFSVLKTAFYVLRLVASKNFLKIKDDNNNFYNQHLKVMAKHTR